MKNEVDGFRLDKDSILLSFTSIFTATIQLICQSSAVCLMGETHRWNYIFKFNLNDTQAWQYSVVNSVQGNFKK